MQNTWNNIHATSCITLHYSTLHTLQTLLCLIWLCTVGCTSLHHTTYCRDTLQTYKQITVHYCTHKDTRMRALTVRTWCHHCLVIKFFEHHFTSSTVRCWRPFPARYAHGRTEHGPQGLSHLTLAAQVGAGQGLWLQKTVGHSRNKQWSHGQLFKGLYVYIESERESSHGSEVAKYLRRPLQGVSSFVGYVEDCGCLLLRPLVAFCKAERNAVDRWVPSFTKGRTETGGVPFPNWASVEAVRSMVSWTCNQLLLLWQWTS